MKKNPRPSEKQLAHEPDELPAKLAKPAQRALASAGITRLSQLSKIAEAELTKLHGMGPKAIEQLRAALAVNGKSFANSDDITKATDDRKT
ncbi:MAG: DNA-binding protein [Acidobacteriota bacterium]